VSKDRKTMTPPKSSDGGKVLIILAGGGHMLAKSAVLDERDGFVYLTAVERIVDASGTVVISNDGEYQADIDLLGDGHVPFDQVAGMYVTRNAEGNFDHIGGMPGSVQDTAGVPEQQINGEAPDYFGEPRRRPGPNPEPGNRPPGEEQQSDG